LWRALDMAQAFLWLARAEALNARKMQPLDLAFLLHQATDEMYALARQSVLSWRREIPDEPRWVVGDFEAVVRTAINLLDNALRHAAAGGEVGIGVQRLGVGRLRFWVDNDGVAPSEEQRERMFKRFSRADATRQGAGAALALYFVRTVAKPMAVSRGSTMSPVASNSGSSCRLPSIQRPKQKGCNRKCD
jgi:signal transduction histidine kinase